VSTTFQDWIAEAIERAGGQTELARKLSVRVGQPIKPQTIQYLASRAGKPARGSRFKADIAAVTGLDPLWKPGEPVAALAPVPYNLLANSAQSTSAPALELASEIDGMELTKDALAVVRAWMALPENEREDFKQKIETASLRHRKSVPDEHLKHMARRHAEKPKRASDAT
jgi:hypothetical protein